MIFRQFQRRVVAPRLTRGSFFTAAHDKSFKYVIQPLIVGTGLFFLAYGTAYYQNIQYNAYKDPHYPPITMSPTARALPDVINLGMGDDDYYCTKTGAVFSPDFTTIEPPDVSQNATMMGEAIRENPAVWSKMRSRTTKAGISLAKIVKKGFDTALEPGCGCTAGDEESYETFKELFDIVISKRHNGYGADATTPFDRAKVNLTKDKIDGSGKYVTGASAVAERSVSGFKMSTALSFEERRTVEKVVITGLLDTKDSKMVGQYNPLNGSRSHRPQPYGMSPEKEEELSSLGQNIEVPDFAGLSSGHGRHWPDARGVYHNTDQTIYVQVGGGEHVKIVAEEGGDNIQTAVKRVFTALDCVENILSEEGYSFMKNDHLGYMNSCPSKLGAAMSVTLNMSIPTLGCRKDISQVVNAMGLSFEDGKLSNAYSLGFSEVDLVNNVISGASQLVQWEMALEQGQDIEEQIQGVLGN